MNQANNEFKGIIYLLIFSLTVGCLGVFIHYISDLNVYAISALRGWICVLSLLLLVIIQGKLSDLKPHSYLNTIGIGLFQGIGMILYFIAIIKSSMANAAFLLYTAPIFSLIMSRIFLKEKLEKSSIIGCAFVFLGVFFILDPQNFSFSSDNTLGNLAALGSGFFYAAMGITSKPLMQKASGYYSTFWQFLIIALMFSPFLVSIEFNLIYKNIWPLLGLGIISSTISFCLFMEGAKTVPGQKLFIISSGEPLVATIAGFLILNQKPSIFTIIGAILILAGIFSAAYKPKSS